MIWEWNLIITLVYWSLIYPTEDKNYPTPVVSVLEVIDHICPFLYVTIDWTLSAMRYERTSIAINLIVVSVYGLINILYTKIKGTPVYDPISWDSPLSWTIGLCLIPLFALAYYLEYWLTTLKM